MKLIPLPDLTTAKFRFTHKVLVDFTDLNTTAGLVKAIDVGGPFPANTAIYGAVVLPETPFVGAGISALTLDFGDGGSAARYAAAANVLLGAGVPGVAAYYITLVATTPKVTLTAVGANLTTLTAGKAAVLFTAINLSELRAVA